MEKVSIFRRAGRIAKSIIQDDEKKSQSDRHGFSQEQVEKRKNRGKRDRRLELDLEIMQETGMTREEIDEKWKRFRDMGILPVSFNLFNLCGLYKLNDEEAREALLKVKELKRLEDELRWDYRLIDLGKLTYEDVEDRSREFTDLYASLMVPREQKKLAMKATYLHPENMSDEEVKDLAMDMKFTDCILKYNNTGYVSFHFHEKSIPERREFVCTKERTMMLPKLNSKESLAVLDDKLLTYEALKEFYGREMVSVSDKDFRRFKEFFDRNDAAVIKPRFDLMGKGVMLLRKSEITDMKKTFREVVDTYRRFLMEGLIDAAPEVKALNPDSVNTVRIITQFNGEKATIWSASMRIGHVGSFVDNVGAGGLTVTIDTETGIICSDARDEGGCSFEKHPETGITFKGYQLPAWDKAVATAKALAASLPGATFVGWDLACNSDYEWVIVEGNGQTGFYGAQAPIDKGRRKSFLEVNGADPRGVIKDLVVYDMAEEVEAETGIPKDEIVEKLLHFEALGLDGRYFKPNRAWELSDEECLALMDKGDKNE